jgi:hypothetical protein
MAWHWNGDQLYDDSGRKLIDDDNGEATDAERQSIASVPELVALLGDMGGYVCGHESCGRCWMCRRNAVLAGLGITPCDHGPDGCPREECAVHGKAGADLTPADVVAAYLAASLPKKP